jgi:hypothetical protein
MTSRAARQATGTSVRAWRQPASRCGKGGEPRHARLSADLRPPAPRPAHPPTTP